MKVLCFYLWIPPASSTTCLFSSLAISLFLFAHPYLPPIHIFLDYFISQLFLKTSYAQRITPSIYGFKCECKCSNHFRISIIKTTTSISLISQNACFILTYPNSLTCPPPSRLTHIPPHIKLTSRFLSVKSYCEL